jgi:hypothetical protein
VRRILLGATAFTRIAVMRDYDLILALLVVLVAGVFPAVMIIIAMLR